jgi:ATP:ADP antiporter, AAA family
MLRRIGTLLRLKPGEGAVTLLMFLYIFGVLFFYYILDPLRKGLFLKSFPSSQLPYAYFLTAIFAGAIATLTFRLSRRASAITLVTGINIAIVATLLYFRFAMGRDIWYLPYIYFVYVKIVSVLSTTQFWLLAGYVYDQRQAKRIYSLLGTGAILGATVGSTVPAFLSRRLSTESMLMICILVCAALILLSHLVWRYRKPNTDTKRLLVEAEQERVIDLWPRIFGSPHLRMMVLLIFLTLIASQIADWQIDNAAQTAFRDQPPERFSQFFGRFDLATNLLAMVLQLFAARAVVNRVGILGTIMFLPACLFLSSAALLMLPSLWTATLARGSDTVSRYSLNRIGFEMLYLPLTPAIRNRLKVFVDVFVDRTGRAVAGVAIIILTSSYFPFGVRGAAAVAMVVTAASLLVCLQLRKTYVNSFLQQLTRREVELDDVSHYVTDPASVQLLVKTLQGANERQKLYSLSLLQSVRNLDFSSQLIPLLQDSSPYVREEAVRTLHALPGSYTSEAEERLTDVSDGVRLAAIDYLCSHDPASALPRLESLLEHERIEIRLAAARWASSQPLPGFKPSVEFVRKLMATDGTYRNAARSAAGGLSVHLKPNDSLELLGELIEDASPAVVEAAATAAGKSGQLKLVSNVVNMLGRRELQSTGRRALLSYGDSIVGTLGTLLKDPTYDGAIRREIPWVLSRIPAKQSAEELARNLDTGDPVLKVRIVKGLNRLRETSGISPTPAAVIEAMIYAESRTYYDSLSICTSIEAGNNGDRSNLLTRALHERLDQKLEMIFRLLGLKYPPKDIYFAFTALTGSNMERRAAAIEFLDNILEAGFKPIILPLLEETSIEALLDRAKILFGIEIPERENALRTLLNQSDVWLKACALHEIGDKAIHELLEECRALATSADPLINETAAWALARMTESGK